MAEDKLAVKIEIDTSSVDKAVKKLQTINFGLEPKGGSGGMIGKLNSMMDRLTAPMEKFATKMAMSSVPTMGGETGMGMGDLLGLVGGLGEGLMATLGPIAGIALIAKGIMDAVKPILDIITMVVAILVLPLSMLLQSIVRPLLMYLFKFLLFAMGGLKTIIGFILGDGKLMGEGMKDMGIALGGDLGKALIQAGTQAAGGEGGTSGRVGLFQIPDLGKVIGDALSGVTPEKLLGWLFPVVPLASGLIDFIFKNAAPSAEDIIKALFPNGIKLPDFAPLANYGADVLKGTMETLGKGWDVLSDVGNQVVTAMREKLDAGWDVLVAIGSWVLSGIEGKLTEAWTYISGLGMWAWNGLTKVITTAWDYLTTNKLGQTIFDGLKSAIDAAIAAAKRLLDNIVASLNPFGGSPKSGDDMVISPGGDIISTNPSDFIIATKDPSSLAGGKGGNITIGGVYVTIQGSADKNDIKNGIREAFHELELDLKRAGYAASST